MATLSLDLKLYNVLVDLSDLQSNTFPKLKSTSKKVPRKILFWILHSTGNPKDPDPDPLSQNNYSTRACWIYRGYYRTARRYEISLRVLKNISRVSAANE